MDNITHTAGMIEHAGARIGSEIGGIVAETFGEHFSGNARRLVAAWNACDGISTEALEAMGAGTFHRSREALELASSVFDRIAQGEPFNDVCEETGCTAIVLAAARGDDAADAFGWRRSYETRADAEGWGIFNEGEIQRDDEADAFASDADAISFVRSCARRGSTLHAAALRRCGLPLTAERSAPISAEC